MEYGKKDWQRSDGRLKTSGRMNQEKGRKLSAYRPADREKSEEKRPNEMMRMGSNHVLNCFSSTLLRMMGRHWSVHSDCARPSIDNCVYPMTLL